MSLKQPARFRLVQLLRNTILFFLLQLLVYNATAQTKYRFNHLTNLDGLSQSTVQAIIKDRYGFMWFGTQDGLNRYDGNKFKVYRHEPTDSTSLRRSHIISLYEDRSGTLWVGTNNGALSRYDRKRDAFVHYYETIGNKEGLSQKTATAILEDRQGNFWVGTYWKLNLLDRRTGKVKQYGHDPADAASISDDGITCLFEDSKGNLWVGTNNGLNLMDRRRGTFRRFFSNADPRSLSHNSIKAIREDRFGRLWVGTESGLNLLDRATGTWRRFLNDPADPTSLGDNQVTIIQPIGDSMWIGTKNSLELFELKSGQFTHIGSDVHDASSLSRNATITALLQDNTNTLWVGTYQGGINVWDPSLNNFYLYRNNPVDWTSLSFNVVTAVAERGDGDMWIGTGGGGLNLWKRKENIFQRFNPDPANPHALASYSVLCVSQGRKSGYTWIGMYGSGMDRFDPVTQKFTHYNAGPGPKDLNNNAVYAVLEDRKGRVWMGTNGGGVNMLDPQTGNIAKFANDPNNANSISGNYVRCFLEDERGHIWMGTSAGLSVYDPEKGQFKHYNQYNMPFESDVIFSLALDGNGVVWVGTLGGGLNRLDVKKNQLTTWTTKEGLPDNTINSIIKDNNGFLWLSTNNGLSRFDPRTGKVRHHGLENGLQSWEFSQGAGLKTSRGEIVFGGINGFNIFDPTQIIINTHQPPVVFTGFRLFNKNIRPGDANKYLPEDISTIKEITLPYHQSVISFDFAALNFTAPEKNNYAYQLEGFDDGWNHIGHNRSATYTNLPPGSYVLKVIASNNDGVWNEEGASIRLIITPPFWQTWWFRLLAVLALVAITVAIFRMRVERIHQQKEELARQVAERTKRLASVTEQERAARKEADKANKQLARKNVELEQFAYVASHDMQEPLRTISSFVELLRRQYGGRLDDKADKYLAFMSQASDRMKVLINDLLEYSRLGRKGELSLVNCNELTQAVLADLQLAIKDAGANVQVGALPTVEAFPTELKQVFQNLIVNALKFRKKTEPPLIEVGCTEREDHWEFFVKDNGIGMDAKHYERIFVIFQRLHTRSEFEGSGIGLSHCKKIVEMHNGHIWVESVLGSGSTFYFTLQRRTAPAQESMQNEAVAEFA
ncbi:hypothetical protein DRJ53_02335 [Paracnuella aquatica]|nr:hypothetical protein DRJ53_02335 [Paracnuella aquatica]